MIGVFFKMFDSLWYNQGEAKKVRSASQKKKKLERSQKKNIVLFQRESVLCLEGDQMA